MSDVADRQIVAPWTPEQVEALKAWQASPWVHPFTCGGCRDDLGTRFIREPDGSLHRETDDEFAEVVALTTRTDPDGVDGIGSAAWEEHPLIKRIVHVERALVATDDGWICPTCDYVQEWAWAFMADPRNAQPIWARVGS